MHISHLRQRETRATYVRFVLEENRDAHYERVTPFYLTTPKNINRIFFTGSSVGTLQTGYPYIQASSQDKL
jgi:hypothetical protein